MALKLLRRQLRYFLQGARLFEQVRRTRNDHQLFFGFELIVGLLIQLDPT
ncbi:MAG: hypothetical protein ACREIQ_03380 [Nitrospiria bacterium]